MKYYIDLGMYMGELLKKVIGNLKPFDKYIGFEPIPEFYNKAVKRFKNNPKVELINAAVSDEDNKKVKFYTCYRKNEFDRHPYLYGQGSTLAKNKVVTNLTSNKFIYIRAINFSQYILNNFKKDDHITLKIDIEGKEYDLLRSMMNDGSIEYIDKIYCEWHYKKIEGYYYSKLKGRWRKKKHMKFVGKVNRYGFNLTGDNSQDELSYLLRKK